MSGFLSGLFFISLTSLLVPSLSAPRRINSSASSKEEMPPAALTLTFFPTWVFISFTSANVAPSVENPVDVLMYSAPAFVTISHILIFSSSVSRQFSMITFKIRPLHPSNKLIVSPSLVTPTWGNTLFQITDVLIKTNFDNAVYLSINKKMRSM